MKQSKCRRRLFLSNSVAVQTVKWTLLKNASLLLAHPRLWHSPDGPRSGAPPRRSLKQLEVISRVFNANPVNRDWASRRDGVALIVTSLCISLPLPTLHGGKCRILPFISGWKPRVSLELGSGSLGRCLWNCGCSVNGCRVFFALAVPLVNTRSRAPTYKVTFN